MYGKLFASLYQGTLRGKSAEILVFTNLIAHADKDGYVDKHFRAIAEEVGLPMDEVKAALLTLESPDDESRSPELEGRRIVRVADSRSWGWRIVNYTYYRGIRNEDDRREQNRAAQERFRNKHDSKQNQPREAGESRGKPMQKQRYKKKPETRKPRSEKQKAATRLWKARQNGGPTPCDRDPSLMDDFRTLAANGEFSPPMSRPR